MNLYELSKVNIVNYFDYVSTIFFSSTAAFCLLLIFSDRFISNTEVVLSIFLLIFYVVIVTIRIHVIYAETEKNNPINVIDLKKVYGGDLKDLNEEEIILIDEKAVDYDMLGRTSIINELYKIIKYCRTNGHYVIALTGSWGSGKTTIINNVESMLRANNVDDLIIIKNFDPWIFEEKDAMFRAMFDVIFSNIGLKFSVRDLNMYYETIQKAIFGKLGLDIKCGVNSDEEIDRINKMINSYLEKNNKRVLFVIDNIERANPDHLLLLFKSISSVFTFNRFIILLSYDKEVMKDIFERKLDVKYEYIDKVIQHEIIVPKLDFNIVENINEKCILNILQFYGLKESEIGSIFPIISEYSKEIKDIRDLKRNINSILTQICLDNNYLNKVDSFIVKYISINDNSLYQKIYENKKYFISYNDSIIFGFDFISDVNVFNKEIDDFFENFFSGDNIKYIGLLSIIFPYVKLYSEKIKGQIPYYKSENPYLDKNNRKLNEARRIYNAKFWDLYFTTDSNLFLSIDISINAFVEFISNKEHDYNIIVDEFNKVINLYQNIDQYYIVQAFEYYLDDIKKNKLYTTMAMYNCINKLNNESSFFVLSARSRMGYIVSLMIKKLNDVDFNKFMLKIQNDYGKLEVIRSIGSWLKSEKVENYNEERYLKFEKIFKKIKNDIIKKRINIYSKEVYALQNINSFFGDKDDLEYIASLINTESIYMFLADMISVSQYSYGEGDSGYEYKIELSRLTEVTSSDKVNEILKIAPPKSEVENNILKIYNNSICKNVSDEKLLEGIKSKIKICFDINGDL